jgi:hypothetical protein
MRDSICSFLIAVRNFIGERMSVTNEWNSENMCESFLGLRWNILESMLWLQPLFGPLNNHLNGNTFRIQERKDFEEIIDIG